jgi:protein-S-isoprenylcysteine O-methyltransferase Ste14
MHAVMTALRSLVYATGFVFLWAWLALEVRRGFGDWLILPSSASLLGVALMVLGGILAVSCMIWFTFAGKGTPAPFDAPEVLVSRGPYRWVRNPMYLGGLMALLGFGLWNKSCSMTVFSLVAALIAHCFVIWYKEPQLQKRFGVRYQVYKAAANRWLPKPPHDIQEQGPEAHEELLP